MTPDSLQYLLHDLFEVNTFWQFETERATADETDANTWQVTLDVARAQSGGGRGGRRDRGADE